MPLEIPQSETADMLNVSERTVRAAVKVKDEGAPELIQSVESGRASVSGCNDLPSHNLRANRNRQRQPRAERIGPRRFPAFP